MNFKDKILFYWKRADISLLEGGFLSLCIIFIIYIGITAPATVTKQNVCKYVKVIQIESVLPKFNNNVIAVVILENNTKKQVSITNKGIKVNSMVEICETFVSKG